MTTVFLRGGLGNQMFQYAAGLALAKKNGTGLRIDTTFLSDRFPRAEFAYRDYDMDVFELAPQFTGFSILSSKLPIPGVWLGLDLAWMKFRNAIGATKIIYEKQEMTFDPEILNVRGDAILYGRWQTEKYFENVKDEVRSAFRFRHPLEGEAKKLGEEIRACNSIALHVRRGDYAAFANTKELMGETDLTYYSRAAAAMADRVTDPRFFIFSDGIEWCKENIKLPFPVTYVEDSSRGPKAAFHLELMSLCKNNITAPSTFSWWGAWLNANPDKIIMAPKKWFADGRPAPDIFPAGWTIL